MDPPNDETPGVTAPEVSDDATSLPSKIDRYGKARQRAVAMMRYLDKIGKAEVVAIKSDDPRQVAKKLALCGNHLRFRHYFLKGRVRLVEAMFCKVHLLCPLCALRRAGKALRVYDERLRVIQAADPSLRLILVTCTVRNGDDLSERFEHLKAAWKLLLHRRFEGRDDRQASDTVLRSIAGGVASFEVTKGDKGWHPHVHALMLVRATDDEVQALRRQLRQEWEVITGDSFECDARPVADQIGAFLEVLKYALKFSDLELRDNWDAYLQLRGRRLLTSFGCFRGVDVPESLTDEPMDIDEPYIDLLYRYLWGGGAYTLEQMVLHKRYSPRAYEVFRTRLSDD